MYINANFVLRFVYWNGGIYMILWWKILFLERLTFRRIENKFSSYLLIQVQCINTHRRWRWRLCAVFRLSWNVFCAWNVSEVLLPTLRKWTMQNPVQFVRFQNKNTVDTTLATKKWPRKNPSAQYHNRSNYCAQNVCTGQSIHFLCFGRKTLSAIWFKSTDDLFS